MASKYSAVGSLVQQAARAYSEARARSDAKTAAGFAAIDAEATTGEIRKRGFYARDRGVPEESNPFDPILEAERYEEWKLGWNDGPALDADGDPFPNGP